MILVDTAALAKLLIEERESLRLRTELASRATALVAKTQTLITYDPRQAEAAHAGGSPSSSPR